VAGITRPVVLFRVHIPLVPRGWVRARLTKPGPNACLKTPIDSPAIGWWRTCEQQHRSKLHYGWETPKLRKFCMVTAERLANTHQHVTVVDLF